MTPTIDRGPTFPGMMVLTRLPLIRPSPILKTAKTVKKEGDRFGIFALALFVNHSFSMSGFAQILST